MSNELVKIGPATALDRYAYEPSDAKTAFEMSKWVIESGFYPHLKRAEAVFAIIAQGRERGLSVFQSLSAYNVIEGRLAMTAQAIAAVVLGSGKALYFRPREQPSGKSATWITQRVGSPCADTFAFTLDMAKARGLTGRKNWQSMPDVMLSWRACAALARHVYPDVTLGICTPDEVLDTGRGVDVEPLHAEVVAPEPVAPPVEPPPARTAESSELRRQLAALQAEIVVDMGKDEAKRRWIEAVGSTRGVQDPALLAAAIERASALHNSLRPAPAPATRAVTRTIIEASYREYATRLGMTDEALAHWTIDQCGGTWDALDDEGRTRAVEGLRAELEIGGGS
jgi:hypothetical protein